MQIPVLLKTRQVQYLLFIDEAVAACSGPWTAAHSRPLAHTTCNIRTCWQPQVANDDDKQPSCGAELTSLLSYTPTAPSEVVAVLCWKLQPSTVNCAGIHQLLQMVKSRVLATADKLGCRTDCKLADCEPASG